jgi:hypothetical protein
MKWTIAAAVLLAVACTPKTEPAASKDEPLAGAPAAKRMPLPDCADVETKDAGAAGLEHPDCRLMSSDKAGLAFEARYSKPVENQQMVVTIQVVAPGDATLQTISEKMDTTPGAPELQDIDGDGRDELLVPLNTGNVNTTWAVWRATGDKTQYTRLEELSGIGISKTESGYISVSARGSANSWDIGFWKFDGDDLEPIASAEMTAEMDDKGAVTKEKCVVTDSGGLKDAGLTLAQAQKQFCAEPDVKDVFK